MRLWPWHGILHRCVSDGRTRNNGTVAREVAHSSLNLRKRREYSTFWPRHMGDLFRTGHMHNTHHLACRKGYGEATQHNWSGTGQGVVEKWTSPWDRRTAGAGLPPGMLTSGGLVHVDVVQKWAWEPREAQSEGRRLLWRHWGWGFLPPAPCASASFSPAWTLTKAVRVKWSCADRPSDKLCLQHAFQVSPQGCLYIFTCSFKFIGFFLLF